MSDAHAIEEFLLEREQFGMRFGLERMRRLLGHVGDPQNAVPAVHVVGTNGKSSTTLMTAEAQPTAYAKKAGEVAQATMQDIPARLMAYAEVAKKAQTQIIDTVVALTPKVVEEATEATTKAAKAAKKAA